MLCRIRSYKTATKIDKRTFAAASEGLTMMRDALQQAREALAVSGSGVSYPALLSLIDAALEEPNQ